MRTDRGRSGAHGNRNENEDSGEENRGDKRDA